MKSIQIKSIYLIIQIIPIFLQQKEKIMMAKHSNSPESLLISLQNNISPVKSINEAFLQINAQTLLYSLTLNTNIKVVKSYNNCSTLQYFHRLKMNFTLQLQQSFGNLLQSPQLFNEISRSAMIELSKIRHANHRLLPPHLVATIISQLHAIKPFQNRKSSLKFAFYFNIIRHIILANFHQLKDNKVFAVVAMIYAQKLSDFYHDLQTQDKSLIILKRVAQISIINQISLKFVKKSKIFFPEYIKALILTVEKLDYSINRNLKHSSKVSADSNAYNNTQGVLNLAFSVDSEKDELIFILIGLLNYVLNQAGNFFTANAHKKDILRLHGIQSLVEKLQTLQSRLPEQIRAQLIVPAEFKKYEYIEGQEEDLQNENQPIYLEEPIQVRQLTPRFYNEEEGTKTKLLRKKRNKLQKKMQLEIRQSTHKKLQERKVVEDVRQGKIQRQVKKDIFVLQQQTEQAKKYHRQMKKVKTIKKDSKLGRKGKDSKPKLGRKGKK